MLILSSFFLASGKRKTCFDWTPWISLRNCFSDFPRDALKNLTTLTVLPENIVGFFLEIFPISFLPGLPVVVLGYVVKLLTGICPSESAKVYFRIFDGIRLVFFSKPY